MTGTACDEIEARARVYRARMARAFVSWCGARFVAKGEYGEWGTQEADPFAADIYVVLGCSHHASDSELVAAYRRAAKRFHPDCVGEFGSIAYRRATEAMTRINAAWESLRRMRRL